MKKLVILCGIFLFNHAQCLISNPLQACSRPDKEKERLSYILIANPAQITSRKSDKNLTTASEIFSRIENHQWKPIKAIATPGKSIQSKLMDKEYLNIPIKLTGDDALWNLDEIIKDIIHYRLNSFETGKASDVKNTIEKLFPHRYKIIVHDPLHNLNMQRIYLDSIDKVKYKPISCRNWVTAKKEDLLERFTSDYYKGDHVTVLSLKRDLLVQLQTSHNFYFNFTLKEVQLDKQDYTILSAIMDHSFTMQNKLFAIDIVRKQAEIQNNPIPPVAMVSKTFVHLQKKHWENGLVVRTINNWQEAFNETFPKKDKRISLKELELGTQARSSMTLIPKFNEPGIMLFQTGKQPKDCKKWKPRFGVVVDIIGDDGKFKVDVIAAPVLNPAGTDTTPTAEFLSAIKKIKNSKLYVDRVKVGNNNEIMSLSAFREHIKGNHIFNEIVTFNTKRSDVQGLFIHRADWDIADNCDGNGKSRMLKQIFTIQQSLTDDKSALLPVMLYDHLTNSFFELSQQILAETKS